MVQYLHFRILEFRLIGWGFFVQPPSFEKRPTWSPSGTPATVVSADCDPCCSVHLQKDTKKRSVKVLELWTLNLHSEILWDTLKKRPDSVLAPFLFRSFSQLGMAVSSKFASKNYICSLRGEIIRWGVPNFQETQQGSHTAVLIGFSPIDPWNIHGKRLHKQNDAALLGFMPSSVAANAECRLVSQYKRNRSLQEKLCRTEWMQADLNV